MNAIENFINDMVLNKTYCRTLKIKDKNKADLFCTDADPYIASKQIRMQRNESEIKVFLGVESLKIIS